MGSSGDSQELGKIRDDMTTVEGQGNPLKRKRFRYHLFT
jgi:hypothetical protein